MTTPTFRERDPLRCLRSFALPSHSASKSRRVGQRSAENLRVLERANRALAALKQLADGALDLRLLRGDDLWGDLPAERAETGDVCSIEGRILQRCRRIRPPADALTLDAARQRLQGARRRASPSRACGPGTFLGRMEEMRAAGPSNRHLLPARGDTFPSHYGHLDLPEPGQDPVDITKVSPRAREYLDEW